ncbi:TPA: hypothetical protein OZT99_000771 [Escherichia coli]|nr:hypothetical protein [Escherichia coli]
MIGLTKERLERFINQPLENGLTRGEQMEMARHLLASMEQEPVAPNGIMPHFDSVELTQRECYQAGLEAGKAAGLPEGWVVIPVEMTPSQMRAIQLRSEAGGYITSNLTDAYSLLAELWEVALAAAPKRIG